MQLSASTASTVKIVMFDSAAFDQKMCQAPWAKYATWPLEIPQLNIEVLTVASPKMVDEPKGNPITKKNCSNSFGHIQSCQIQIYMYDHSWSFIYPYWNVRSTDLRSSAPASCDVDNSSGWWYEQGNMFYCVPRFLINESRTSLEATTTGWWFEPLWKILVNWDDYSQYMGKKNVPNHQPEDAGCFIYFYSGNRWLGGLQLTTISAALGRYPAASLEGRLALGLGGARWLTSPRKRRWLGCHGKSPRKNGLPMKYGWYMDDIWMIYGWYGLLFNTDIDDSYPIWITDWTMDDMEYHSWTHHLISMKYGWSILAW